jgi:hypothetical protein
MSWSAISGARIARSFVAIRSSEAICRAAGGEDFGGRSTHHRGGQENVMLQGFVYVLVSPNSDYI